MIDILLAFPFDVSATILAERLMAEDITSNKGRIDWLMTNSNSRPKVIHPNHCKKAKSGMCPPPIYLTDPV